MLSIPWKYLTKYLLLPNYTPVELAEKLTYYGLETRAVEHEKCPYLEFNPLPNRPDLLSGWGIIQEIAVLLNFQVKPINFPIINKIKEKLIEVVITTPNCHEFHLGLIKNIEVKESPLWIKEWLKINNVRSINNVVDIANLVMLESGQPIHIFDYDTLPEKKKIIVRQAQEGKKIKTLQEQELTLTSEDTVISSAERIIDLAGIIGTQESALTSQSKNILIECANFNPETIKKTAKRLNISTVASQFFGRGSNLIFPLKQVLQRTISLIIETYEGDLAAGTIFTYQPKKEPEQPIIVISQNFIEQKIGQKFPEQIIENIWQQLKLSYQKKACAYYITRPTYRPDISLPEDLLEELLRVYDYNKVVGSLL